jgi:protein phosphatase
VAWLRRLGMPLVRIRAMIALPSTVPAPALAKCWAQAEADTATKR